MALDVFKAPVRPVSEPVVLKCRPKGCPENHPWMSIYPGVWNEIVDDMEFYLCGWYGKFAPSVLATNDDDDSDVPTPSC